MGLPLIRYRGKRNGVSWGCVREGSVRPLPGAFDSLAVLLKTLTLGEARASLPGTGEPLNEVEYLAPVTAPCQIICQGKNYLDHLLETGVKPKNKEHNLLFSKADSTLAPAVGAVCRPPGVRLLDYEIELGLVIARDLLQPTDISEASLAEYVAGFVMANDISARDIQVPERQWFRGKSFRGFCPVGPIFFWAEAQEVARLFDLELELKVNGKVRQKARAAQLMHRPAETLSLISRGIDLRTGDLILTGTPGGVAMRVPPKGRIEEFRDLFLSDKEKFARFIEEQAANGRYLSDGDRIESVIRTADGAIDLGLQDLVITGA